MNHCFSVKSLDTSIKLTEPEREGQLTLGKCQLQIIGRAKRAPHWGVQSRFRVIGERVKRARRYLVMFMET